MNRSDKYIWAWAIFDARGKMALFSSELPIFWLRKVAIRERNKKLPDGKVLRVKVNTDPEERLGK